jgi:hypothetical protein
LGEGNFAAPPRLDALAVLYFAVAVCVCKVEHLPDIGLRDTRRQATVGFHDVLHLRKVGAKTREMFTIAT